MHSQYKKKYFRFILHYNVDSKVNKTDIDNKVNLRLTYYSNKKDISHNYYLQHPKPMIETKMLKILDIIPNLIKLLGADIKPIPLIEHII